MNLNLLNISAEEKGIIDLSDDIFGCEYNESLIHQVVTSFQSGSRSGTKAQKTRSEVRGGGAKPWRQKGTGRARAGTSRSPIWRGGGRAFAARPRTFTNKVNKKMYRGAMRSILSELVRQKRLIVLDKIELNGPKTKDMEAILRKLEALDCLIVLDSIQDTILLSARNLPKVELTEVKNIDPVRLISFEKVVITQEAIKTLEGTLS